MIISFALFRLALLLWAVTVALAQTPCERLKSLSLPNTTITAAESVAAGPFRAPGQAEGTSVMLPAHCRVAAVLAPSSDSHIEMEVWLPADWNGKFEAVGNGGWAGVISIMYRASAVERSLVAALREGYATASTDTGHKVAEVPGASFALGHPEKLIDFAYRAVHEMTAQSKAIVTAYYGRGPRQSYWNGCSTGGRQALMEAQRYSGDFDGILAGAPANYWAPLMTGMIVAAQAAHEGQPGNLPREKLSLLNTSVLQACDALDGIRDGLIEDPTRCRFDPKVLECNGSDGPSCLTAPQVDAARKLYASAANIEAQQATFPGMMPGSELGWDPINGLQPFAIGESHFRYLVFKNAAWDFRSFSFDRDSTAAEEASRLITATGPNLKPFFDRGGKLIQYHGWNDQQISPTASIAYYKSVGEKLGGQAKISGSYRLFMAPGMMHCGGGPGPNEFNGMAALERWRESGIAPDQITASHVENNRVIMTRPLCPYPQVAKYKGTGSTNDTANFSCIAP